MFHPIHFKKAKRRINFIDSMKQLLKILQKICVICPISERIKYKIKIYFLFFLIKQLPLTEKQLHYNFHL